MFNNTTLYDLRWIEIILYVAIMAIYFYITDMYGELALLKLFIKDGDVIDLPQAVKEDKDLMRSNKTFLAELEVCCFFFLFVLRMDAYKMYY